MVHALIIESQEKANFEMRKMITNNFSEVKVVSSIMLEKPDQFEELKDKVDIVFFYISSCVCKTDFSVLDGFTDAGIELVVISSDNVLPIELLNLEILYFIEQPFSEKSIERTLRKFALKKGHKHVLIDSDRISVPVRDGWEIIEVKKIIYVKADSNYSDIILEDGSKRKSSKPLKHFAGCLDNKNFIRIHQSYLVNPMFMRKISKEKSPSLELSNGTVLPVSRSGKQELRHLFIN